MVSEESGAGVFLALDAGVRETGWAVFRERAVQATGVIKLASRRRVDAAARVNHLVRGLDQLVERWHPEAVACCQPSGIGWRVPALDLLGGALVEWSQRHYLRLQAYTSQEVRAAVAGHPNAARGDLSYAVMWRFGLIGHSKTTHEWEAIAVGDYHLRCRDGGPAGL